MPVDTLTIKPTGNINRRDMESKLSEDQVIYRENLRVIGKNAMSIKKIPGSDRYNATSVGNYPVTWAGRYYGSGNIRKNFFYSGGKVYFIDENGNTTELLLVFALNAYPVSIEMKVSDGNIMFLSEGVSTGMYSHDGNIANVFNKEVSVTQNFVGLASHLDRLFAFEEDSEDLYFSANLDPTNFTDSTDAGLITIGAKRGSKIQQIGILNETLYIFKTDSMWVLEGRTPSEFTVREVHPYLGLAARRSLQVVEGQFMGLMSDFEVYSFGGSQASTKLISYEIALGGDLTKDLVEIVNRDRMDQVNSVYHNYIYRLSFVETGQITNNMEYCFDAINQKDFLTRGNNVGCYLKYDRIPDKNQLVTGRSDVGRLMHQYRGLNWDNDDSTSTMPIKLRTRLHKDTGFYNIRIKKVWGNFKVLGASPIGIKTYLDGRNAASDSTEDQLATQGETKALTGMLRVNSQSEVLSRYVPRWGNSKGSGFILEIDENIRNRDLEFSELYVEAILKNRKRSHKVHV